jgi:hypothetical protein
MATVRHLGLFALPNVAFGGTSEDFLQGRLRCPQPAEAFTAQRLDAGYATLAPANLPQSTYTDVGLERAMLWLWRIKTFTVSGSIEVEDVSYETTYSVEIGPLEARNLKFSFLSEPIESEKEKVCDCGMFYGEEQSSDFEDLVAGSHRVTVSIGAIQSIWANYPNTPAINVGSIGQRLRINQSKTAFFIPVLINLSVRSGDGQFDYQSGSSIGNLSGSDKSILWEINDSLGSVSRPFRFGGDEASGTITITASEYWPYDPGDGLGPIYDSATGAQLRGFPS